MTTILQNLSSGRQKSGAEDVRFEAEVEALIPAAGEAHRPLHAWLQDADSSQG